MSENKPRRRAQAARAAKKSASRKSGLSRVMLVAMMMVMVAVVSIGGTLAWLQDETDTITNTFTTSDITITLEETKTDFKMVPGATIAKDPKVTVQAGSEDCWLFVKIEEKNNLDKYISYTVDASWAALADVDGVYWREVASNEAGSAISVLANDQVTVNTGVSKTDLTGLVTVDNPDTEENEITAPQLTFTAYAIQKHSFADAAAAWTELNK